MDLFDAIARRHSYRGPFLDKPVSREDLQRIVQAGLVAPSGKNAQTTRFVIVDDEPTLQTIRQMHEGNAACQTMQAMIACIVDREPEQIIEGYHFQIEDCAAAVENMLLAITALGYAAVWIDGWLRRNGRAAQIGQLLGVANDKVVRIMLPIGVPAEQRAQPDKLPFDQRAWFDRYQG